MLTSPRVTSVMLRRHMQYAGGLARWTFGGDAPIALSAGALIGAGSATLTRTYADLLRDGGAFADPRGGVSSILSSTLFRVRDEFFVAEPQVDLLVRLAPWVRLDLGGSYRAVGGTHLLEHQLRGPSGSVSVRLFGR